MQRRIKIIIVVMVTACGAELPVGTDGGADSGVDVKLTEAGPADASTADVLDATVPDVSSDAADVTPFSPLNIAGLVIWLEGDLSSSISVAAGHVVKWADQTPHHNNATASTNGPLSANVS